jgi:hypothetical protein
MITYGYDAVAATVVWGQGCRGQTNRAGGPIEDARQKHPERLSNIKDRNGAGGILFASLP